MQKLGSALSLPKGFTLVEILLVMGIFAVLASISSIAFFSSVSRADLDAGRDVLLADLKTKQANAMAGSTDTTWSLSEASSLPSQIILSTTFPGDAITFTGGSGEIVGYSDAENTLTLQDSITQKTIRLNRYGVVIGAP